MKTDFLRDNSHPLTRKLYRLDEPITPERVAQVRQMTMMQKFQEMSRFYYEGRQEIIAYVRQEHPDWDEETIKRELIKIYAAGEG